MRGRSVSRAGNNYTRRLGARSASRKGQQRDIARPLDGHAQPALMPRANAGHPTGQNLPAFLHELRKNVRALVVDEVHLLDAKFANFLLPEILALTSWPSAGTAWATRSTATGSAFTPGATVPAAWSAVAAAFTPRCSAWR